jgi:hypothetical protein
MKELKKPDGAGQSHLQQFDPLCTQISPIATAEWHRTPLRKDIRGIVLHASDSWPRGFARSTQIPSDNDKVMQCITHWGEKVSQLMGKYHSLADIANGNE